MRVTNFAFMRIWIDIDNSPHVPFFKPIIEAMKSRGDQVMVTSREYAQTRDLLTKAGIDFEEVGAHAGASTLAKILNLIQRSFALAKLVRRFKPDVAVSHGSRALSVASKILGIRNVLFFDYEWTEMHIFKRCATVLACPTVLPQHALEKAGIPLKKIVRYNGFKEEVYLPSFIPDPSFRSSLDIPDDAILVTIRPSSMTSNYHDSLSEDILKALVERFATEKNAIALVTPRTDVDKEFVRRIINDNTLSNVRIAERALPGMQLLYWSDVVVSGGGTMNREAALLGTPTISMFTGERPSIDEYLCSLAKLRFIESPDDVGSIPFVKKHHDINYRYDAKNLLSEVMNIISG